MKHGIHVAFTGGTGVLTFLDLVALILRANLGLLNTEDIPIFGTKSTFKFILYVSFASRKDSLALDLMEGLS